MGSSFSYFTTDVKEAELKDYVREVLRSARAEYGTDVYSGQMNNKHGVSIYKDEAFQSEGAASEYVCDNTDKWDDNVLAVPYEDTVEVTTSEPTFEGKPRSECSNRWHHDEFLGRLKTILWTGHKHNDSYRRLRCDQLSDTRDRLLLEAVEKALAARTVYKDEQHKFRNLVRDVERYYDGEFTAWTELKAIRRKLPKLVEKQDKLIAAASERDKKYSEKLYKTNVVNNGRRWLVGSWCPE